MPREFAEKLPWLWERLPGANSYALGLDGGGDAGGQ